MLGQSLQSLAIDSDVKARFPPVRYALSLNFLRVSAVRQKLILQVRFLCDSMQIQFLITYRE